MPDLLAGATDNAAVGTIVLSIVAALVGLWLAAAWWTFSDVSRRTTSGIARCLATGWVLLSTPVLLPLSLGAYLLARPQVTVAEARAQRLFEAITASSLEVVSCPTCGLVVDADWRRCPTCATWLAARCAGCGAWSPVSLQVCPYCARERVPGLEPAAWPAPHAPTLAGAQPVAPGMRHAGSASPGLAVRSVRPAPMRPDGNREARVRGGRLAGRDAGSARVHAG